MLTELGDPQRLAAGYADAPLYLIGPAFFLDYRRVLTALLVTIVPLVAAVVGIVGALGEASLQSVLFDAWSAAMTAALHIGIWTTLAFAVLERIPSQDRPRPRTWTPAALPEPPSRRARLGELIAVTVGFVLVTSLVLLAPVVSPAADAAGNPISVLSPQLWENGIIYVFIGLVMLSLGAAFARYYAPWSAPLAVGATLVDLAPPVMLIWLAASDRLVNPAFIEAVGWPPAAQEWINRGLIIIAILSIVSNVIEEIGRARRRRPVQKGQS